jgi:hypothetical protein
MNPYAPFEGYSHMVASLRRQSDIAAYRARIGSARRNLLALAMVDRILPPLDGGKNAQWALAQVRRDRPAITRTFWPQDFADAERAAIAEALKETDR